MDEFIDYEKLDEEYPDLVIHQDSPDSETDDYFDYEELNSLFPDLLINFEDYEYIVPFDYEKLDAEFPELLDFSKYLPTFFVRKDNIKTDHAKFGVDYIDFLNALNSTSFPKSLSKIKSAYGTVNAPVSTFGGKGRVIPIILYAINFIKQYSPDSNSLTGYTDVFGGSGVLTLNTIRFKNMLGFHHFHYNDLEPGLASLYNVLNSESMSEELVDLLKSCMIVPSDNMIPLSDLKPNLYKKYVSFQNSPKLAKKTKLNKKTNKEEECIPKDIDPHLNRGTFKAAEAFISNAPYDAETFFSAFKSIHAPEKGKNAMVKSTGREVYSIENTSQECLTFCRVMALLYNKNYDEDLFKKLVARWYIWYISDFLIKYPIPNSKSKSKSESKHESDTASDTTSDTASDTNTDTDSKSDNDTKSKSKNAIQPRFIDSLKDSNPKHKSLAIRQAAAEYIRLMASNNNSRANFNNNKKSMDYFNDESLNRIVLAHKLVQSEKLSSSNLDVFDLFTFIDQDRFKTSVKLFDPPYIHSTRSKNATDIYIDEFSFEEHKELAETLKDMHGWILCGYLPADNNANPYACLEDLDGVIHVEYTTHNYSSNKSKSDDVKGKKDKSNTPAADNTAENAKVTENAETSENSKEENAKPKSKPIATEHLWIRL